jgi:hypothetical protein
MPSKLLPIACLALALSSCKFDNKPTISAATVSTDNAGGLTGAIIKNDIDLEATDVKVSQVYLMDEQNQLMTTNDVAVGQKAYMTLKLDTGWSKIDGKSYIGASERITTPDGTVVLDAGDLFKDYESQGIDAEVAKLINLSAVITQKAVGVDVYNVSFKVWDKKGSGVVTGKYKLTVK